MRLLEFVFQKDVNKNVSASGRKLKRIWKHKINSLSTITQLSKNARWINLNAKTQDIYSLLYALLMISSSSLCLTKVMFIIKGWFCPARWDKLKISSTSVQQQRGKCCHVLLQFTVFFIALSCDDSQINTHKASVLTQMQKKEGSCSSGFIMLNFVPLLGRRFSLIVPFEIINDFN